MHPSPRVTFDLALLADALQHLPRHLGRVTPQALAHPAVPLLALAAVAAIGARGRRWSVAVPAAMVLAITLAALGVPKVHDATPSVFFSYERMFLALPPALALVALCSVGAPLWSGGTTVRAAVVCAAAVLAIGAPKQVALAGAVSVEARVPQGVLRVVEVEDVRRDCEVLESTLREAGTDLAVFVTHSAGAYACGALAYDRIETLFPAYERRTWLLVQEQARPRDGLLLVGVSPDSDCWIAERAVPGSRCLSFGPNVAALRFAPRPAVDVLRALGVAVRPF